MQRSPKPEVYERLEAADIDYAIRLPANQVLQRRISYLLTRPVGRPPKKPIVAYASFHYQAKGWTRARRWWPRSNGTKGSCTRGSASSSPTWPGHPSRWSSSIRAAARPEQWIKEGKNALRWRRLLYLRPARVRNERAHLPDRVQRCAAHPISAFGEQLSACLYDRFC